MYSIQHCTRDKLTTHKGLFELWKEWLWESAVLRSLEFILHNSTLAETFILNCPLYIVM